MSPKRVDYVSNLRISCFLISNTRLLKRLKKGYGRMFTIVSLMIIGSGFQTYHPLGKVFLTLSMRSSMGLICQWNTEN